MKKIALFAIIALTASCITTTAQIKKYEKVLFVLTSHSELEHRRKNRILVEEFAAPYYELADKGVIIDIASRRTATN
jgi:hypothetical protein